MTVFFAILQPDFLVRNSFRSIEVRFLAFLDNNRKSASKLDPKFSELIRRLIVTLILTTELARESAGQPPQKPQLLTSYFGGTH